MKNKKFFAKALAFAMVMGTVGFHGTAAAPVEVVKAATDPLTITFDYQTYEATVTSEESYVCLQVLKDAEGSKITSEAWYPVVDGKAVIDMSFLKATKEQYIRAKGMDGTEGTSVTITAQTKTSIKYDAKTQSFLDGKTKTALTDADLKTYEYRTLYGSYWGTVSDEDGFVSSLLSNFKTDKLENAVVAGTTIVVRKAAVASKAADADSGTAATNGSPAGTEVKLKITAVAKAPKVKVDYTKGTITLPKGVEIVITTANGLKTGSDDEVAWTDAAGKLEPDQLLDKLGVASGDVSSTTMEGYIFAVRTKAVDGKKPASKLDFITINPSPVIAAGTLAENVQKIAKGNDADDTDAVVVITCEMLADGAGIKLTPATGVTGYAYSTDGKKWTAISGEVTVKVADKAKVQICAPAVKGDEKVDPAFASNTVEVTYSYTAPASGD